MRRRQEGFTIIEVLIAMVLLMIGFLALTMLQIGAFRGTSLARSHTLATILAYEQIERFQRLGYDNVTDSSETASIDGRSFSRSWTTSTTASTSKVVEVEVGWSDQWGSHAITLPAVVRQ